ncbi:MAG: SUMF1/EgtB/PvdO family nonheme iron enzyme [Cytophagales bacterium]|nr:SUMF1/EgtB/PvdO family nonheme iron enzyme [Cytophagales bacterium]
MACSKQKAPTSTEFGNASSATGLDYANTDSTFHPDQVTGGRPFNPHQYVRPNMVFIEGGRSLIGFEENEFSHTKTKLYTATVESFFMDETEIANIHWNEYLHYMRRDSEQEYISALPDTLVWVRQFAFNDFYVENYLRHPAFRYYPVVGVSWLQANDYCQWRTEVVRKLNDKLLNKNKKPADSTSKSAVNDTTKSTNLKPEQDSTFTGNDPMANFNPQPDSASAAPKDSTQKAASQQAVDLVQIMPEYRLPTEAEWIYAAQTFSYMEPYIEEKDFYKRIYPWDGSGLRNPYAKKTGYFFANYKRGRGDYAGVASSKNDGAIYTEYIYAYPPNDVGLYNMSGNVNEWVQDLYEYVAGDYEKFEFNEDADPYRRKLKKLRKNTYEEYLEDERHRVYKGGSWSDNSFWLSPFTRRYLDEDSSTSTIGFRCVMSAFPTEK